MALTREQILARKTVSRPAERFDLDPDSYVLIRGMSHGQAFEARVDDAGDRYDLMIHFALVDPILTVEEVHEWRLGEDAGVIEDLVGRIMVLSGLTEGAGKSSVPSA